MEIQEPAQIEPVVPKSGISPSLIRYLAIFLVGILSVLLIFILVFSIKGNFLKKEAPVVPAAISGHLNINGDVPQNATVVVAVRKTGTDNFLAILNDVSAVDKGTWSWSKAINGTNYDVQGYLQVNGVTVIVSDTITVTAPAANESLAINMSSKNNDDLVTISGVFDLNGYIPTNSTITITQIPKGQTGEQLIQVGIKPVDNGIWSWKNAKKGKSYTLYAYLKSNGVTIGKSDPLNVDAPAQNEVMRINSVATPVPVSPSPGASITQTPQQGLISGTINLNGPVPANSRLTIFQRVAGTSQFKLAVDNLSPADNVSWAWNSAQVGVQYELLAILKTKQNNNTDVDSAYSKSLIAYAPAQNELLTINTGISLPPPTNQPSVQCNNQTGSGQWNITVRYNNISTAGNYWLQVGSQTGASDVLNFQNFQSNNNPQIATAVINSSTTYYARYAYTNCSGCTVANDFSAFSNTLVFACPPIGPTPSPTPAYTGYNCLQGTGCQLSISPNPQYPFTNQGLALCQAACVTPTPTPTPTPTITPTPTPTSTPTPTPTPKISQCNESCGGSGYTCITGLDCVSLGEGVGTNICRNPACTDRTDCVCQ